MGIRVRDEVPEDERDPDLIRVFGLHNLGMTMAMPPESVDRLIGGQSGYTAAQLDLQWRLAASCAADFPLPEADGLRLEPACRLAG